MEREGKRVTKAETIAVAGVGVALLGVVIAGWADTRAGFNELRGEIGGLRLEVKQDITDLRTELKRDITDLRTELRQDIVGLRGDVRRVDDRLDEVNVRLVAVEVHTGAVARNSTQDKQPLETDAH